MSAPYPEQPPSGPLEAAPALHPCWRCRKLIGEEANCPHCGALNASSKPFVPPGIDSQAVALAGIMYAYGAMLAMSLLFAGAIRMAFDDRPVDRDWLLFATIVFYVVDTFIVLFAAAKYGAPAEPERPAAATRVAAWGFALPLLAVLIGINLGYHALLKQIIGRLFVVEDEPLSPLLWVNVLVMCALPAIVEEWFFRKLAFGALRTVMGSFAAVLISSLMFGLAHIYVAFSVPYLIFAGMAFGWARAASGGITLPILVHFLHNLAVVLLERHGL